MATNRGYTEGLLALLAQTLDPVTDTLTAQFVDGDYVWSPADTAADLAGFTIGPPHTVTGTRTVSATPAGAAGLFTDDETLTVGSVTGDDVRGVVLALDGTLVGFIGTAAGRVPILVVPDGGGVDIRWPDGLILTLGG